MEDLFLLEPIPKQNPAKQGWPVFFIIVLIGMGATLVFLLLGYPLLGHERVENVFNHSDDLNRFLGDWNHWWSHASTGKAFGESPACSNGLDDDKDGLADFPDDPGCWSFLDNSEEPVLDSGVHCGNGVCDAGENIGNCLLDCFSCNRDKICGISSGENQHSCPQDCG